MRDLKIWMRAGDWDCYNAYDSPEEAANDLAEFMVVGLDYTVERAHGPWLVGVNIANSGLKDENGVSLYWGDDDAQLETELSELELEAFTNTLKAATGC